MLFEFYLRMLFPRGRLASALLRPILSRVDMIISFRLQNDQAPADRESSWMCLYESIVRSGAQNGYILFRTIGAFLTPTPTRRTRSGFFRSDQFDSIAEFGDAFSGARDLRAGDMLARRTGTGTRREAVLATRPPRVIELLHHSRIGIRHVARARRL
jgi:hypothetical protein